MLAQSYFNCRILGAPAALSNYVVQAWLINVQRTDLAMWANVVLNLCNAVLCVLFGDSATVLVLPIFVSGNSQTSGFTTNPSPQNPSTVFYSNCYFSSCNDLWRLCFGWRNRWSSLRHRFLQLRGLHFWRLADSSSGSKTALGRWTLLGWVVMEEGSSYLHRRPRF